MYKPRASLMNLTMFGLLEDGFGSGLFSSAFNLFFWLLNSNSTLRNPMQYRRIPSAETVVAKQGRCCFWLVIFMRVSLSPRSSEDLVRELVTWYSLLIILSSHLEGKDQVGFDRNSSVMLLRVLSPPSVEAPAGNPYKISNNRKKRKRAGDRGKREKAGASAAIQRILSSHRFACALFFFLPSLPTTQRGLCGGESFGFACCLFSNIRGS